jgi:hypothetical protein
MKIMHAYCFGCLFLIAACRQKQSSPATQQVKLKVADTAKYFPIAEFFKEQIEYVDLRNFVITQLITRNGKKDSSQISKNQFLALGALFAKQAGLFQHNKQLYKEAVFQDLSTNSYTLNYTPVNAQAADITNIDVLLDDDTNAVKRVFIKRIYTRGDSTITEQYSWKANKSFQLTGFTTTVNSYTASTVNYVNWNDK